MKIERLSLLNFKNITDCELFPADGLNCIVGPNGAGKTNVVDAIYFLSMSKSSLPMTDGQCISHSEPFFMLSGEYTTSTGMGVSVSCGFKRGGGKSLKFCGKEYERLADHIGVVPVVMVSPADGALVSDSADERRRWLNAFISQLNRSYLDSMMRYNRLLAERNSLLKQGEMLIPELLDVLDERLAVEGGRVAAVRAEVLEGLAPVVERLYGEISGQRESVKLSYRSEAAELTMEELLRANRAKDLAMGFTTGGVHRDDVTMSIGGYPLRKYGSQGQQKSFLLALKLAQYEVLHERLGERPILLLDDLFDKLDEERLARLLRLTAEERYGQVFITDCNRERMVSILGESGISFKVFDVEGGRVECGREEE